MPRLRPLALVLTWFALVGLVPLAHAEDASARFSPTNNPSYSWAWGWAAGPGQPFSAFASHDVNPPTVERWFAANGASISRTCSGIYHDGIDQPLGGLVARPAPGGAATVLRWTAPTTASYRLNVCATPLAQPVFSTVTVNLNGTQLSGQFGAAVANAGDVNGDGFDDLLVGEPLYDGGQTNEGRVRLYLGSRFGPSGSVAWSYESNQANAQLGFSVAGLGDVNGDGFADVIVGAPLFDPNGTTVDGGAVFVFMGSATGLPAAPSWSAFGPPTGSELGYAVAGAGDVNGDGFDDVLVGAPYADNGQNNEGRALLWKGSATGLGPTGSVANAAWSVESNEIGARMGYAVAGLGDVNGDGRSDVLVSAPWFDDTFTDAGRTLLYRGTATALETASVWSAHGSVASEQYGAVLARVGDLNGDGRADAVIGTPNYGFGNGKAEVFFGVGPSLGSPPVSTIVAGLAFGFAIAGLGDVNRDGRDDVAIGEVSGFGTVRLYRGDVATGLASTTTSWTGGPGYDVGRAIAGGDFNSDGERDVALGEPLFDATFTDMGRVALVRQIVPGAAPATTVQVSVVDGTSIVAQGPASTSGAVVFRHALERPFVAGQTVDIAVTDGGDGAHSDAVRLDVTAVAPAATTQPLGPAVAFANQRFLVSKGVLAFDNAAFDPINRHIASQRNIRDLCGVLITANGPPGGAGLAWDVVTQQYLSFDPDGPDHWIATLWSPAGELMDTLFTIPRVLDVPGIGPDTLETPRGIATDPTSVYIVDGGPPNVTPYANAWFKLTRAGVAVAGREGANFAVNATGDVVDDIVYSPLGSGVAPGSFLVPVEHTGLFTLDADGAATAQSPWTSIPGSASFRPPAFAGLALDPTKGDLYLVDNDRGYTQTWTRLPSTGVARSLLGTGGDQAYLRDPENGCNNPLWRSFSGDLSCDGGASLVFGIAYRPADERVYASDYASGDLWRFEPLSGLSERVGPMGRSGMWGLACDSERDVLFSFDEGVQSFVRIDPRTGEATNVGPATTFLIEDLAYVPRLDAVFGVDLGTNPPQLVSFRPGTGVTTVIGPTHGARGLDYDPTIDALLSTDSNNELWRIDPATGAASLVKTLEGTNGWEGLAVVPVAPLASVGAPASPVAHERLALRVGPNPTRAGAVLHFALAQRGTPEARVVDVSGRLVRRLGGAELPPGEHALWWDGRDGEGRDTAPGVYFVSLRLGKESRSATVVRIR